MKDGATAAERQKFVVADDHPLFRGALTGAVAQHFPGATVMEAGTLDELSGVLDANDDIDLVLIDLNMPGMNYLSGLAYIRAQYSSVPLVVVSAHEEAATIRRSVELGASGFIPKSLSREAIGTAIASVLDGDLWVPEGIQLYVEAESEQTDLAQRLATLTPQQVRVLIMLREGLLNKQIAFELGISEATVKAHVSAILQKLGVDSRTQAVIAASRIDAEHGVPLQE